MKSFVTLAPHILEGGLRAETYKYDLINGILNDKPIVYEVKMIKPTGFRGIYNCQIKFGKEKHIISSLDLQFYESFKEAVHYSNTFTKTCTTKINEQ